MSLYDDMEIKQKSEQVAGWSSGIKLLQSQLQLKKAVQTQPRRDALRKAANTLAPVMDLKSKKEDDDSNSDSNHSFTNFLSKEPLKQRSFNDQGPRDSDWKIEGEYDPMWPNDYEKVVKDLRDIREREKEKEEEERRRKKYEERERRRSERFEQASGGIGIGNNSGGLGSSGALGGTAGLGSGGLSSGGNSASMSPLSSNNSLVKSGFSRKPDSEASSSEDEDPKPSTPRTGGAAIAPPPSLQENVESKPSSFGGSSVAAKIMAKYGFKEGQGLGKQEQGLTMALQVEKTSKRGGRIISEKEIMPPPPMLPPGAMPPPQAPNSPPSPTAPGSPNSQLKNEPSITEIMKSPAKVVLLRNMVGPGEVDEDLEPEVKDECNTKYGDVIKVIIFEQHNVPSDEAVRIFVEFKRIESAIKAVVDLNGRFFGGRQVKAGFYSLEKFANLQLLD